jgi:hypothetical protein
MESRAKEAQGLILRCSNDNWGLPGKISPRLQMSLLIQSQDLHRKSLRLRTVLAQFVHGRHLQDWLISVSPDNRCTYRYVITVAVSRV